MALSEASATGIPQWDAGQGKRLHYNHLMPTPQDLSAATWLAKLAAPGGKTPGQQMQCSCGLASCLTCSAKNRLKATGAGTQNVRQIQRKTRRQNQSDLVRQLDAVMPETFRRGVSFNGAGNRALGKSGRSLHDVLEDCVLAVASLRARKRRRLEGDDDSSAAHQGSLQPVKAGDSLKTCCGPDMRAFLHSHGCGLERVLVDAGPFVSLSPLSEKVRAVRRRNYDNDTDRPVPKMQQSDARLHVDKGVSASPESAAFSSTASRSSCGASLAPLLEKSALATEHGLGYRLPPIVSALGSPSGLVSCLGEVPAGRGVESLIGMQQLMPYSGGLQMRLDAEVASRGTKLLHQFLLQQAQQAQNNLCNNLTRPLETTSQHVLLSLLISATAGPRQPL